ncbi:MAG: hypothetical protein LUG45_05245 [Clostridiales bacterium]|nr:hypothetical protein [Clostridiales bacterium]
MTTNTINHYLKLVSSVEHQGEARTVYHVGHDFAVDVSRVPHDLTRRGDLMNLWYRSGCISQRLPSHLSITTYFTDCHGDCHGDLYNITVKPRAVGAGYELNFDFLREATPDNEAELVAECIRLEEMGMAF